MSGELAAIALGRLTMLISLPRLGLDTPFDPVAPKVLALHFIISRSRLHLG